MRSDSLPDPVVDIGIPAFGRPGYLVETIESVLAQTLESWRLTVSEDGAGGTDIASVVEPYLADPRIHYVVTGERLGQRRHSTKLIRMGAAPYVALLHDDDRWHAEFLARRVAFLDRHDDCGFVFSGTNEIDETGRKIGQTKLLREGVHGCRDLIRSLLRWSNVVGHPPSVVVRRSAYEAVGAAFDERFPYADYEMWFRLALRFPAGYLAVRDADYRVHRDSSRFIDHVTSEVFLSLFDHLVALADEERPGLLSQRDRNRNRSSILLAMTLDALEEGERRRSHELLRDSLHTHPPSLVDPRVLAWLLLQPFGTRAAGVLKGLRTFRRRHRLRLHLRAVP